MWPMKVYRVSADRIESQRRRAVKVAAVQAVFTFITPLIITECLNYRRHRIIYPLDRELIILFLVFSAAMGCVLAGSIFWTIRRARRNVDLALSIEITVEEGYVTKRQDGGIEVKLALPEIKRIEQYRKAFVLRTDSPGRYILVPQTIEGYDQLKTELIQMSAAPLVERKRTPLWEWLVFAGFLSSIGLLMLKDKLAVGMACLFIIGVLTWSVLRIAQDQNVTRKARRQLVLGFLAIASAYAVRAWIVWNS